MRPETGIGSAKYTDRWEDLLVQGPISLILLPSILCFNDQSYRMVRAGQSTLQVWREKGAVNQHAPHGKVPQPHIFMRHGHDQ